MDFISKSFEDMKKKIAAFEKTNVELAKENHFLRQQKLPCIKCSQPNEIGFDEQEQYIRLDCLEIRGVPTSFHGDTNEIVKKVGSIVDVCIGDKDISISIESKAKVRFLPLSSVKFRLVVVSGTTFTKQETIWRT